MGTAMAEVKKGPLESLEQWDDFVKTRYRHDKDKTGFRNYRTGLRPGVEDFYRQNHASQTLDFVLAKQAEYAPLAKRRMGVWEALQHLNTLVDDSDPDTDLSQIEHALQTSEAVRADGHPRWFVLTGLIHDMGKMLCFEGEPQWAVVGDTFPVGCAYSDKIVFPEFFAANPDAQVARYQTEYGIYTPNCGMENVHLSWGHDEYLFHVTKRYLPEEAQYMIRYHSFYSGHRENAYDHLFNDRDRQMFSWVRAFNPYDLYSKSASRPDVGALKPYYTDLIAEFFPEEMDW